MKRTQTVVIAAFAVCAIAFVTFTAVGSEDEADPVSLVLRFTPDTAIGSSSRWLARTETSMTCVSFLEMILPSKRIARGRFLFQMAQL